MKPPERFEKDVIGAVIGAPLVILLTSLAFLPSSLLRRAGDPKDLRFIGYFMLTILCLVAIGGIGSEAHLRKNKWLLLFAVPPLAVLTYEGWYILKRIVVGLARDPATLWTILFLIWVFLTWWLWEERRQYKKEIESWRSAFQQQQPSRCPHCGAEI
jgi:hypothetical protein